MEKIYEQFDKATMSIGAYAILKEGKYVARVVFRHPRDGAGRLYCYLHIWGAKMVRGHASGFGYDKRTAAFEAAAVHLKFESAPSSVTGLDAVFACLDAAAQSEGWGWERRLEQRGFTVAQVC